MCNTSRLCGSPAIDGYAHVDVACLERSETARTYLELVKQQVRLDGHTELEADYDGLAVRWGIGHQKANYSDCEAACREHVPGVGGGPFKNLPCNAWSWCGREACWEPDAHKHLSARAR